jgi:broad-specificity NMP kinase
LVRCPIDRSNNAMYNGVREVGNMRRIYLVVGIPGSGKSWVCENLQCDPDCGWYYIAHDMYQNTEDYLRVTEAVVKVSEQRVVIETPFSISKIKDPLEAKGYQVVPVFIIEASETVTKRYIERFEKKSREDKAKALKAMQGNLTRQETYKKRAQELKAFSGTSSEVLEYLKGIPK